MHIAKTKPKTILLTALTAVLLVSSLAVALPQKVLAAGETYTNVGGSIGSDAMQVTGGDLGSPSALKLISTGLTTTGTVVYDGTLQHKSNCTINVELTQPANNLVTGTIKLHAVSGSTGTCSDAIKQGYDNQTVVVVQPASYSKHIELKFWWTTVMEGTSSQPPSQLGIDIKDINGAIVKHDTATGPTLGGGSTDDQYVYYYGVSFGGGWVPDAGTYQMCPNTNQMDCVSFFVPSNYTGTTVLEINTAPLIPSKGDVCGQNAGEMGWLVCPTTDMFQQVATLVSGWIHDLIQINTDRIYNTSTTSGGAFYTAWKIFRALAYALLVIVGLIMVVSQIAGVEIFDAYAIRKLLPKMVLAAVIIPLLWPLLALLTNMANDSAKALEDLIKAPFAYMHVDTSIGSSIATWFQDVGLAVGVGAAATAAVAIGVIGGWGVIIAAVAGLVLAILQAFFVIAARGIVYDILIIASPVAVVLGLLFDTVLSTWRRYLTGILLSIPFVAAELAASQVGAAVAREANPGGLGVFLEVIFLVTGLVLFWPTLKTTDKIASQVDGVADKVTGWAQKGLSNYRNKQIKKGFDEATLGVNPRQRGLNRVFGIGNGLVKLGDYLRAREHNGTMAESKLARMGELYERNQKNPLKRFTNQDDEKIWAAIAQGNGDKQAIRDYFEALEYDIDKETGKKTRKKDEKTGQLNGRYHHLTDREVEAQIDRDTGDTISLQRSVGGDASALVPVLAATGSMAGKSEGEVQELLDRLAGGNTSKWNAMWGMVKEAGMKGGRAFAQRQGSALGVRDVIQRTKAGVGIMPEDVEAFVAQNGSMMLADGRTLADWHKQRIKENPDEALTREELQPIEAADPEFLGRLAAIKADDKTLDNVADQQGFPALMQLRHEDAKKLPGIMRRRKIQIRRALAEADKQLVKARAGGKPDEIQAAEAAAHAAKEQYDKYADETMKIQQMITYGQLPPEKRDIAAEIMGDTVDLVERDGKGGYIPSRTAEELRRRYEEQYYDRTVPDPNNPGQDIEVKGHYSRFQEILAKWRQQREIYAEAQRDGGKDRATIEADYERTYPPPQEPPKPEKLYDELADADHRSMPGIITRYGLDENGSIGAANPYTIGRGGPDLSNPDIRKMMEPPGTPGAG